MTVFDYAVLVIVCLSMLLSVIRGLVRELLALLAWGVAFAVSYLFGAKVALLLPAEIPGEELRMLAGFLGIFFVVLLMMGLLAVAMSRLVKSAGLSLEDRILGGMFGLARGLVVVVALVMLAGLTSLPKEPVWRNAVLSLPFEVFANSLKTWLPQDVAQRIRYD